MAIMVFLTRGRMWENATGAYAECCSAVAEGTLIFYVKELCVGKSFANVCRTWEGRRAR